MIVKQHVCVVLLVLEVRLGNSTKIAIPTEFQARIGLYINVFGCTVNL